MPVAFYNLDQLKAAGLPINKLPATWNELETLLESLRQRSGQAPFLLGGDWYDWLFEATVIQAGGALMSKDGKLSLHNPASVKALAFWKRLKDKGLLDRSLVWKDTLIGFTGGRYPVIYYSSGGMEMARNNGRFAWMADMMPKDAAFGASVGGGNLFVAAEANADERAAALKFARFLYRPENLARGSAATGYFPVSDAAFADPALKTRYETDEPFVRVRRQLKFAKPKLMTLDNLKTRALLKAAIDRSLDGGMDPAESLRQAQIEGERALTAVKAEGRRDDATSSR